MDESVNNTAEKRKYSREVTRKKRRCTKCSPGKGCNKHGRRQGRGNNGPRPISKI